ncbi:MAG: hypothetical protein ACLUVC_02175 [Longibaculum sp.]
MIKEGTNITLRPYKHYKDNPENDVPVGFGEDHILGKHLKFQVMDVNNGAGAKPHTGFAYINVYTELPIKVGDMVTVDKIVTFQIKKNIVIIGVTIRQTAVGEFKEEFYNHDNGFGVDF